MSYFKPIYNKAFLFAFGIAAALTGCDRNYETIFEQTPDERAQASLNEFNALLMDAPFGWKATLYTGTGTGFFYYLDFKEQGKVSMLSDFDATTAGEEMESTWKLKSMQQPTLSFTTYSYIHLPADPDRPGGVPGNGLLSDSEFAFVRTSGDSVILKGTQHQAEMIFVKATEHEAQTILDKRIQQLHQYTAQYLQEYRGYTLTLPDETEVPLVISIPQKLISFQHLDTDGEVIRTPVTTFTFSIEGIVLREPIVINDYAIHTLIWDDDNSSYYVPFASPVALTGTDEPFVFNTATPLHAVIGHELVTATVPEGAGATPLPGQSVDFTDAYNYAATAMLEGDYRLTLRNMRFIFVPNTNMMRLEVQITQQGSSNLFVAQYWYSYLVREDGSVKFIPEGSDENGGLLYFDMYGILVHFENDNFELKYLGGAFYPLAAFFSREEPSFHFSGYLLDYGS